MRRWIAALAVCAVLVTPALAAEATTQTVTVDGTAVTFSMYTVYNQWGFSTNYVKLRDVAWALKDTPGRFNVSYDGSTVVTTGADYLPVGGEMAGTLSGPVTAKSYLAVLTVDGVGNQKEAYLVTPQGSSQGNFYFKLRDLGQAIGFTVGWSADRGVYIETQ